MKKRGTPEASLRLGHPRRRLLGLHLRHRVSRRSAARARSGLRSRRERRDQGARRRRPEEPRLLERNDPRVGADADAPGLQVREPQREERLRLRYVVRRLTPELEGRRPRPPVSLCFMDPFATLGIARAFDVDLAAVEKMHRELSRALHPDRYVGASETNAPLRSPRRSRSTRPGASCATPSGAPRRCWPSTAWR